jgi:hypothetical protein
MAVWPPPFMRALPAMNGSPTPNPSPRGGGERRESLRDFHGNVEALGRLRAGLRDRLHSSPLCDAPRFARHLEAALRGTWRRWCAGAQVQPAAAEGG